MSTQDELIADVQAVLNSAPGIAPLDLIALPREDVKLMLEMVVAYHRVCATLGKDAEWSGAEVLESIAEEINPVERGTSGRA